MNKDTTQTTLTSAIILALLAVYIVWGSTYLGIRIVNQSMPALLSAGVRFLIAGCILAAWKYLEKKPRPTLKQTRNAAISGLLLFMFGNGAVVIALKNMDSGIAALVIALTPVLMVAMEMAFGKSRRPGGLTFAGMTLGFAGLVIIALAGSSAEAMNARWQDVLIVIGGITCWAAGSIFNRNADVPVSNGVSSSIQMLSGGTALLLAGLLSGEANNIHMDKFTGESLIAFVYLIFFGSILAFSAYNYLLQNAPPALTSTYAYVNPIVALALGALIGGEVITSSAALAAAIIVVGVFLITIDANRRRRKTAGGARIR